MGDSKRSGWSFAAGLMVGGAIALWASVAWLLPAMNPAVSPGVLAAEQGAVSPTSQLAPSGVTATSQADGAPSPAASGCGFEPMLAPTSARDGRFSLEAAAVNEPPSLRGYSAAARDAARQGRLRDSEVALIVACRLAAGKWPAVSVPVADMQSQLAQRYLEASDVERDDAVRAAILERAEGLLEKSLLAYTVVLGSDASKTRMATRRLALLAQLRDRRDRFAGPAADGAWLLPEAGALATLGAGAQSAWGGVVPPAAGLGPAETAALIRSDPELTQLEADVARLRAQAANVTRDPDGLRQRSERALAQREAQCRDKPCLLRWYAQRKRELLAEF